jgi:hypothetical protein
MNQAAMDKMFAQLAKSARIDVFKTSLDSMQEALEVSKKIRKDEEKATGRNNAAQQKMLAGFASGLERQLSLSTKGLLKAQAKVQKALRTGNEAEMKIAQAEASRLSSVVSDIMKRSRESAKEIESYNKALETSNKIFTQDLTTRREKVEELGKAGYIAQEVMLGSIKSSADALKEGVSSLEGLTEGVTGKLTKFFHKRAASFDEKARSEEDPGKASGFMQMAKSLGGLAKTLAVVGGSVTILVSLFSMAEGAVKDMNKSILSSVSYTDLMAVSGEEVQDKFKTLRSLFTDGSFLDELGMTSDDLVSLGGSLNDANLGMRALGGGNSGLELTRKAMKDIKTESLRLGISMDDAVSRAESFAYEIGVSVKDGAFLKSMVSDFGDIRDMAVQTGYSTANFYTKVKGLTDQLDNMNLRTKEAGSLFIRLGRIVGPDGVSGLLSGTASLKDEDYLDQIKRQMLTDKGKTKDILEAEAQRSASNIRSTFGASEKGMGILAKAGLDTGDNKALVASMQKMSTENRQALLGELALSEDTAGLGRELAKSFDVVRGSSKGASRTDRSRAFDSMGAGAGLAMQYARLETHLGGRDVSDMSDIQKKAMMSFTDLTKAQVEQFGRMQDTFKGQFRASQDMAAKGSLTKEEEQKLSAMGLKAKGGKLLTKDTDIEVKDIAAFILAQSESIDKTKDSALSQEQLLSQNVVATVSLADRINKYLGEILMDISGGIMDMVNYFFGRSETEETKANKAVVRRDLESKLGKSRDLLGGKRSELLKAQMSLKVASPKEKKKIKTQISTLEKDIKEQEDLKVALKTSLNNVNKSTHTPTFLGMTQTVSKEEIRKSALRTTTEDLQSRGALKGTAYDKHATESERLLKGFNTNYGTSHESLPDALKASKGRVEMDYFKQEGYNVSGARIYKKGGSPSEARQYFESGEDSESTRGDKSAVFKSLDEQTKKLDRQIKALEYSVDSQKQKKEAVEQEKAKAQDSTVKRAKEKNNTHLAEEIVNAEKKDKLSSLATALGVNYGADAGASTIAEKINQKGLTSEQLLGYGYEKQILRELGIKVENINDGLFTNGKMYRFDQKDDILAMKPGGAVSQLGGGTINATINVNGAGDPEAVGRIVMREMENLNKRIRGGAK